MVTGLPPGYEAGPLEYETRPPFSCHCWLYYDWLNDIWIGKLLTYTESCLSCNALWAQVTRVFQRPQAVSLPRITSMFCKESEWVISFYLLSIYAPEKACYMILPLNKMAAILQVTFSNAFLYEWQFCILIQISLKFVHKGPIDIKWVLVQVVVRCQTGNKPLSEPVLTQVTDAYIQH